MKIGAAEPADLGIGVGEQAPLQKRVIGEINARNQVAWMKCCLFGLGKEVDRVSIEHHPPDHLYGNSFLGNDFRRVQDVEIEILRLRLVERLDTELPFGKGALSDRLVEITAMKVWVRSVDFYRFVPNDRG